MIAVKFLADHEDSIPTLAVWFRAQWPDYYANWSRQEMEDDFLSDASRDQLPSRLVAFAGNELAGTIVLRAHKSEHFPTSAPELGGLFVPETYRKQGIGTALVQAGMRLAHDLGHQTIYATTVNAAGILEGCGWQFEKTILHHDEPLALYQCRLAESAGGNAPPFPG